MAIIEYTKLSKYEKTYVANDIIEHVSYSHIISKDGEILQSTPHRIVLDRDRVVTYMMPDGTLKTTNDIISELS